MQIERPCIGYRKDVGKEKKGDGGEYKELTKRWRVEHIMKVKIM